MLPEIVTFIDAGVLIAASRGEGPASAQAWNILDDDRRVFVSSVFVQLEVLPKALYYRRQVEADYYQAFFESASHWVTASESLIGDAHRIASQSGLAALDALHIAAALSVGVDEFITTEKPGKPIYRVPGLTFVTLR